MEKCVHGITRAALHDCNFSPQLLSPATHRTGLRDLLGSGAVPPAWLSKLLAGPGTAAETHPTPDAAQAMP